MPYPVPSFSIIIPHLNQAVHLERCLRSLRAQRGAPCDIEIIVVDNGSTTLPSTICDAFVDVRLIREPEPGPGPARNAGIAASSAPILAFIDADCLADEGWLAAITEAFSDPQVTTIGGDVRIALADQDRLTALEAYESIYAYRQKNYIERQGFSGTGNLAMRRAAFELVGPFAGIEIAEDRDWGQRATRAGLRIRYVPEMIVYHPARQKLAELYVKWDRHMAHDYEQQVSGSISSRISWLIKAIALALSPVLEIPRVFTSDRVSGLRDRLMALQVLARIRAYRARLALQFLFTGAGSTSRSWNRTS